MPTCAAPNCSNRPASTGSARKSFHKFPLTRPELVKEWLKNIGRPRYVASKGSILCSDHFDSSSFYMKGQRKCLKEDAVPTVSNSTADGLVETSDSGMSMISTDAIVKVEPVSDEDQEQDAEVSTDETGTQPNHAEDMLLTLHKFQQEGYLCDTVLVAKDGRLKAHSAVLAAASPVFKASLVPGDTPTEHFIVLSDIDLYIVEVVVQLVYTGDIVIPEEYIAPESLSKVISVIGELGLKMPLSKSGDEDGADQDDIRLLSLTAVDSPAAENAELMSILSPGGELDTPTPVIQSEHVKAADGASCVIACESAVAGNTNDSERGTELEIFELVAAPSGLAHGDDMRHICVVCNEEFKTDKKLSRHMHIHADEKPYVCQHCDRAFSRRSTLLYHITVHTAKLIGNGQPFQCEICNKIFENVFRLRYHIRCYHRDPSETPCENRAADRQAHICDVCGREFPRYKNLACHRKIHNGEKPYVCQFCSHCFHRRIQLIYHMSVHSNEMTGSVENIQTFPCKLCDRVFDNIYRLRYHDRFHHRLPAENQGKDETDGQRYSCSECGRDFAQRKYLMHHQKIHSGEKPYLCQFCGSCFRRQIQLQIHTSMHYSEITGQDCDATPFHCQSCDRSFANLYRLQYHVRWQHKPHAPRPPRIREKKFFCPICEHFFGTKSSLLIHMRRHTGEKPHKCLECGKAFRQPAALIQHRLLHTGIRPYKCETCNRTFVRRQNYMVHIESHYEEPRYVCRTCGKQFWLRPSFVKHEREHADGKRFECGVCGRRLMRAAHLYRHMATHTLVEQADHLSDMRE